MKLNNKWFAALLMVAALVVACQDESSFEDDSQALSSTSQLTAMLNIVASHPTDVYTAIDSVPCFTIQLPVEVVANGQHLTVAQESDISLAEDIFNASGSDDDSLEYVYPITVVYPDYTEVVITGQAQFNQLAASCGQDAEFVNNGCVAINYPVTVYTYNSSFQVENTYTVENSRELYVILQGVGANEYYSLDYPVSITGNGQVITVNNNAALLLVLHNAFEACGVEIPVDPGGCDNPGVLTDNLILYMTFSNSVEDLMGGTVTAPDDTAFVTDRSGNTQCAVSFNGSQHLRVSNSELNSLVQGNVFSISLWFRMQNTNPSDYEHLFRKGMQGGGGFNLSVFDGNTPLFGTPSAQLWDNNWNADQDLWQDTENWHHLVITFDVLNTARLYRDGVLQNVEIFSADIGTTALDYYIGLDYTGFLDDLRVYKKVLSQAEVQTLFELEGDCSTCVE
jgi:hypothetical protein